MKLIYFAPVAFDSYWQRPHYMMRYLLENGFAEITWVNPYPTRLPVINDLRRCRSTTAPAALMAGLKVVQPRAVPIEPLPLFNRANRMLWRRQFQALAHSVTADTVIGIGRPSRMALALLHAAPQAASSFIDIMDDFSAFYRGLSRRSMRHMEQATVRAVRHVLCSAVTLQRKYADMTAPSLPVLIPNGYDMSRLPPPRAMSPAGRPVIGFVGSIAAWFDWDLVVEMAEALPHCLIRLIGPVFGKVPARLPPNIELLGECPVEQAVRHTQQFTIGIIPFLRNELTRSVDPIKFYELRGMGVPVWSSAFGTMQQRIEEGEAVLMQCGVAWGAMLDHCQGLRSDVQSIQAFRREYDWHNRFAGLAQRIQAA